MKRLLILLLLFSSVASAQNIPGYTYFNSRQDIFTLRARAGMHLPGGSGSPVLASGQWVGSGAIWVDTVGMKVYVKYGTSWAEVGGGSELTPLGSGYPLLHEGVGVKSIAASDGLSLDTLVSGEITARLGGTLTQARTITGGANLLSISHTLTNGTGLRLSSLSTTGTGDTSRVLSAIYRGVNSTGNRTTSTAYFENTKTGGGMTGTKSIGIDVLVGDSTSTSTTPIGLRINAIYNSGNGGDASLLLNTYNTATNGNSTFNGLKINTQGNTSARSDLNGGASLFINNTATFAGTGTLRQNTGIHSRVYGSNTKHNVANWATALNGAKNYAYIAADGVSSFNTDGDTAYYAYVNIGASTSAFSALYIEDGTTPSSLVDGMLWHSGDSLYFRAGSTTYNLTHAISGGGTPTWQQTLTQPGGSWLTQANVINQNGYSMQWNGPNFFKDTTVTQITEASFNSGIDYLVKSTSTEDTVINLQLNVADFFKATASTNGSQSSIWMQPTSGDAHYFLGHTDSLGTLIRSGVRGDDHYGLLYSVFDTDSAYVRTRGHEGLKLYGGSTGVYELANVPTYDGSGGEALVIDDDNRVYKTSIGGDGTTVVIGSDVSSSASTSAQDITGMSWTATSGTLYEFEAVIFYTTSDATIGAQFGINGPASPTYVTFQNLTPQTATSIAQGAGSDYSVRGVSSNTILQQGCAVVRGFIQTSSTGTVTIRFAPETATASGVVIKAGSRVKYWARN